MKVLVKDANIIIDLIEIDLIDEFFRLDYDVITSDFVRNEITDEMQSSKIEKYILLGKLAVKLLEGEELFELLRLKSKYSALSIQDCSVVYLVKRENGILLSGDRTARFAAKEQGTEYHGILWVFDRLLESKIITYNVAIAKMELLMEINNWLPAEECEKRIRKWKSIK